MNKKLEQRESLERAFVLALNAPDEERAERAIHLSRTHSDKDGPGDSGEGEDQRLAGHDQLPMSGHYPAVGNSLCPLRKYVARYATEATKVN